MFLSTKFTSQITGNATNPVEEMLEHSFERLGTDYIDIDKDTLLAKLVLQEV